MRAILKPLCGGLHTQIFLFCGTGIVVAFHAYCERGAGSKAGPNDQGIYLMQRFSYADMRIFP